MTVSLRRSWPALALAVAACFTLDAALRASAAVVAVDVDVFKMVQRSEAALDEMHQWLRQVKPCDPNVDSAPDHLLSTRLDHRSKAVTKEFEACLKDHPENETLLAAQRSFIAVSTDELAAIRRWEEARAADPQAPEPWLDLAHFFYHHGPSALMIECHERAVLLAPHRADVHQQYATAIFLFRKDARDLYNLSESEVFDRALRSYRKALLYDPANYELARDLASSFTVIKPARIEESLAAWNKALEIATTQPQREDSLLNLARIEMHAGRFAQAHQHLALITGENLMEIRTRIEHNLAEAEQKAAAQAVKN